MQFSYPKGSMGCLYILPYFPPVNYIIDYLATKTKHVPTKSTEFSPRNWFWHDPQNTSKYDISCCEKFETRKTSSFSPKIKTKQPIWEAVDFCFRIRTQSFFEFHGSILVFLEMNIYIVLVKCRHYEPWFSTSLPTHPSETFFELYRQAVLAGHATCIGWDGLEKKRGPERLNMIEGCTRRKYRCLVVATCNPSSSKNHLWKWWGNRGSGL